jgi:hypothetical protein
LSWWNPYDEPEGLLTTGLTPDRCRARLEPLVAPWWGIVPTAGRPFKGRVSERGFHLYFFHFGAHGFETVARARMVAEGLGTSIRVRFGLRKVDVLLIACWIPFVVGMWLAFTLAGGPGDSSFNERFPTDVFFGAMLGFFCVLYAVVRWWHRDDAKQILGRLCESLDARSIPTLDTTTGRTDVDDPR